MATWPEQRQRPHSEDALMIYALRIIIIIIIRIVRAMLAAAPLGFVCKRERNVPDDKVRAAPMLTRNRFAPAGSVRC